MIRIAVVEDTPISMKQIKAFLERYQKERGIFFEVEFFEDGMGFLKEYKQTYNLVFLDIEMPNMDGLSTAREIRKFDSEVILVFVTRTAQYALKGYEVRAMDYLVKPLKYDSFCLRMDLLIKRIPTEQEKSILLSSRDGVKKIPVEQLIYVEVIKHKLFFYLQEEVYEFSGTMKWAEEQLEAYGFARCDNGILVNLRFVTQVGQKELIAGPYCLKISRPKRKDFLQELAEYIGSNG